MVTHTGCAGAEESMVAPAPTRYEIHYREAVQPSWWMSLAMPFLVPIAAVAIGVFLPQTASGSFVDVEFSSFGFRHSYEKYKDDTALVAGAISVAIVVLYCWGCLFSTRRQAQTRDTELSVTICPLGIQRSKIITTSTASSDSSPEIERVCNCPLVPLESIKDCILLEHVGGFSVTTHVMIRVALEKTAGGTNKDAKFELVPAFPDAILTFDQCHDLVHQIQGALGEMR